MVRRKVKPRVFSAGYQEKQHSTIYRFFTSQRFLAIVGLVFLILIAFPLARTYSQKKILEKELADIKAEIEQFDKEEIGNLEEMIKYLNSEQSVEAQARLNLNLKKPGETVVVIEKEENKLSQEEANLKHQAPENNLLKWWQYFFAS